MKTAVTNRREHARIKAAIRGKEGSIKSLIITGKPSVARDIIRILKYGKNIDGAIEGERYVVTWGLGHLMTLADPEDCDREYKKWKMGGLPIMPEVLKAEVIKQTSGQCQTVKNQIYHGDVGDAIIATGAGREGELMARLILKETRCSKPIRRLWISSVTDKAIKEGFINLKDRGEYNNPHDTTMCRVEADWPAGTSAVRTLTCKYSARLSCGRVQTPTLTMIAKRKAQVRAFAPQPYSGLQARKDGLIPIWQGAKTGNRRSSKHDRIEGLAKDLKGEPAVVAKIKRTPKKMLPPLLYDPMELQRDASRRFNYPAKNMLNIMQSLYENHKVLTCPKTDSRYLSANIVLTLRERLKACSISPYKILAGRLMNQSLPLKPFFVDNSKVSGHRVIISMEQSVQISHMTIDERRIYDLVARRFLAVLYPLFEYDEANLEADVGGQRLTAKGRIVKSQGWKAAYNTVVDDGERGEEGGGPEIKDQQLPDLKKGDVSKDLFIRMTEDKTGPPAPFNEATLFSAMEDPVTHMETKGKAMVKTLGETGGLGIVVTGADAIEKLSSGFLLERWGRDICLTSKARQLLELVPEDLKKLELTAGQKMKLSGIAKGSLKRGAFMRDIRGYSQELIRQIKAGEGSFRHDSLTNTRYPVCGKWMLTVKGENTEILVCQDRECGHQEVISHTLNARCSVCRRKMELGGKGDAQIFVCGCGHKKKLKAFQERRKKEGVGVSGKDVARYLDWQKKETGEPVNNTFIKTLAGINLKDKG